MRVEVTVTDEAALAKLAGLRDRAGSLRPALELIAADFHSDEQELFAGRGHWKPLDPAWAARKARLGFTGGTLIMTENLEQSLTSAGGKWSVEQISDTELVVGTTDPVAHLHQAGTKKMSARPPVRTTHATRSRWSGILRDWLVDGSA